MKIIQKLSKKSWCATGAEAIAACGRKSGASAGRNIVHVLYAQL
jgi:hypothetical protein